jgi:hypothetical protein
LSIENDGSAAFSYCEKGFKTNGKPSIVFVHGLSSNKETWLPIIKVSNRVLVVSFNREDHLI